MCTRVHAHTLTCEIRETSGTFVEIKKASKHTDSEMREVSRDVKAEGKQNEGWTRTGVLRIWSGDYLGTLKTFSQGSL